MTSPLPGERCGCSCHTMPGVFHIAPCCYPPSATTASANFPSPLPTDEDEAAGYTPTTAEVREAVAEWMWSRRMFRDEISTSDDRELDRWAATVGVDVRERTIACPHWSPGQITMRTGCTSCAASGTKGEA